MEHTVFIIDDHELVAHGFAKYFEEHPSFKVLSVFTDPEDALKKIKSIKPDIVISDLDMPIMNGLELITQAKQEVPETKYVLLTMHLSKQLYQKAKKLGIQGYLPKSTDEEELFMCLQQLIKGKTYYSQKLIELLTTESMPEQLPKGTIKLTQMLSEREREILILVAEGYSTKEIGAKIHLAPKTIETHRKNIMNKLEVKNVAGMVRVAVKEGLLD